MRRVLMIGIDAETLDLVEPYVAAGHLPRIGRLLQRGAYAPLRSTIPVMSPPAWTSMITGLNPGKHGIFDFVRLAPGSYKLEVTRSDQTSYRTIFDLASQHGRRVLAVNVPLTYPPRPVNGVMISGPIVPDRGVFTHPPQLTAELRARGYEIDPGIKYVPGEDGAFLKAILATTRMQTQVMLELMQAEPWDLAMIVLRIVDEAIACFWHHADPTHPQHDPAAALDYGASILEAHIEVDRIVDQLVQAAGPDTVVLLVSDHGAGPCHKEVFLNVWLEQHGWLVRRRDQALNRWRKRLQRRIGLSRDTLRPLMNWSLARRLRKRVPQRWLEALLPERSPTLADLVDWSRTRAYSLGNIGQIYVNLKGREAQGIVEPGAERERLLDELTSALYQLSDEGKPVVDRVYRNDEIYEGPYTARGADLNVMMRGMAYTSQFFREMSGKAIFAAPENYTGTHRPLGVVAMEGEPIAPSGKLAEARIEDVAPTVLWLLGLPIPEDFDGKLLTGFLRQEALRDQPPASTNDGGPPLPAPAAEGWADAAEEQEVLERLRNLGYLE